MTEKKFERRIPLDEMIDEKMYDKIFEIWTRERLFRYDYVHLNFDMLKILYDKYPENRNELFIRMCEHSKIDIVKRLLEYGEKLKKNKIDVRYDDDLPFRTACRYNNLEVAKYLYGDGKEIDVHLNNDEAFIRASAEASFDVVKWLWTLDTYDLNDNDKYFYKVADEEFVIPWVKEQLRLIKKK